MTLLVTLLGTAGLGAMAFVLVILARLTHRWELVTRSRSHYQLFYVSAALLLIALFVRVIRAAQLVLDAGLLLFSDPRSLLYVSLYHLPLVSGMTIGLMVAWRNWGWLVRERDG